VYLVAGADLATWLLTGRRPPVLAYEDRLVRCVTRFKRLEGVANPGRGLRATEKRNVRHGQFPAVAIPLGHQLMSLRARMTDKIEKARRYTFQQFDEVWLLVSASLADPEAIVSTSLIPLLLTPEDVNKCLDDEMLRRSKYAKAFIHIQVGDTVYRWTRESGWQLIHGAARLQPTDGDPWFKSFLPPFPPR
jgi:hypothetical protein